jgi:hypothetical protein
MTTSSSMSNWENPIRGVADVVEDFLNNILDFYQKFNDKLYLDLIQDMWNSNHGTVTWKSKAKYPVIGILLPRLGVENVNELILQICKLIIIKVSCFRCYRSALILGLTYATALLQHTYARLGPKSTEC